MLDPTIRLPTHLHRPLGAHRLAREVCSGLSCGSPAIVLQTLIKNRSRPWRVVKCGHDHRLGPLRDSFGLTISQSNGVTGLATGAGSARKSEPMVTGL